LQNFSKLYKITLLRNNKIEIYCTVTKISAGPLMHLVVEGVDILKESGTLATLVLWCPKTGDPHLH